MSERKSKNVYKKFCEENRIRYSIDDCGNHQLAPRELESLLTTTFGGQAQMMVELV